MPRDAVARVGFNTWVEDYVFFLVPSLQVQFEDDTDVVNAKGPRGGPWVLAFGMFVE